MPRQIQQRTVGTGVAVLLIMATAAAVEHAMGRVFLCRCGTVHFWVGSTTSPELSQQIADWYCFSHIIHGLLLYGIFHLLAKHWRCTISTRLILTTLLEASWEMLENSPIIINRYRQTAAQGYTGDSILNSMSDISFCLLGFALARWLPPWFTILSIVAMELGVGYKIHDNLTLNIIMLIHPFAKIKQWQLAIPG